VEISQLRYFLKVAERQNFTKAADDLVVSQPALSRSIAKLEDELGQPVFERQSRSVTLTDAGRLLRARAEQILALIDDTLAEITDDGQAGRIRVGAIPTIAAVSIADAAAQFFPGLSQGYAAGLRRDDRQVVAAAAIKEKSTSRSWRCRCPGNISNWKSCSPKNCCWCCPRNIRWPRRSRSR